MVDLFCRPCSRLFLPDSFASALPEDKPAGFWLQVEGCPNGPSWVEVEYNADDSMLLGRGWKSFARSRKLTRWQSVVFQIGRAHV